ncbi:MAG: translation initiation factor IF-2, partial [Pseudanabaena sp. CAN_BIN31]|nr:translation initiation factor IF-2 [Pseudanabaena sp. CAN_BIN31]
MSITTNRVRLYELSRELDLDTKDVISVCEQLDIVVKSHSSTITESEAEMVRTKAPQHQPKATESKTFAKKAPTVAKTKESESRTAKQQILAVTKPTIRLNSPPPSANVEVTTILNSPNEVVEPSSAPSPKTAVTNHSLPMPPASSLVKPPSRPSVSEDEQSETIPAPKIELISETVLPLLATSPAIKESKSVSLPESELIAPPTAPKSNGKVAVAIAAKVSTDEPTARVNPSKQAPPRKETPKAERPIAPKQALVSVSPPQVKVVAKPAAPVAPSERPKPTVAALPKAPIAPKPPAARPSDESRISAKASQSVAEQDRIDQIAIEVTPDTVKLPKPERPKLNRPAEQPAPAMAPTAAPAGGRPQSRGPKLVKDSVLIERGITAPTEPPHNLRPPMPTLMRAPEKPVIADRTGKKPDAAGGFSPPTLPDLLEKPTLPNKANKRKGKSKEEEEKDLLELKEKNRLNKPKRYLRDFADEDDDDANDAANEAAQISLSLARPAARPKAVAAPSKPTMAADIKPTQKGKRSAPSRDRRHHNVEVIAEKPTSVQIEEGMTVAVLANRLVLSETEVIRTLFMKGIMANINQTLDVGTAKMVATELGYEVHAPEVVELALKTEMIESGDLDKLQRRPPVVTIMGHVDHGKTTLLDAIRKSKVAQGEAGGITQHIGAYHVDVEHNGQKQQIVFLDTPGHEAFTAMRARGTKVTDIAVLVVAADDGVQPQTIEAISHARAAKVPIVVAINKVDKIDAQPDRVRQELTEYSLVAEEWGGDTIMVPVSAIKRENLDTLLEMILLVAEVEDLQANPNRTAKGTVIEAHLDKAKGPVATLLVQNGTLRVGDIFVAGAAFGKVRAMVDDRNVRVDKASPSFAVEVLGLGDVPAAGDEFEVYLDEKQARAIADQRTMDQRQARLVQAMASRRVTLGTLSEKVKEGELKELNIILKADVQGSLEAILGSLAQLPQREVQLRILLSAPGEITENDISLAAASSAVVLGFNTTMAPGARQAADEMGVDFRDYNVIYKLLEDIQDAMEGLLDPEMIEEYLGQAEVRAVFAVGKGAVAGCYVQNGKLLRNCNVRVKRGNEVVHSAVLDSLRRVKD